MKTETIETIANAGSKTTAGGAVVGAAAWAFLQSNAVGLLGLFIALLGLLVNLHYKRKAHKRYAEEAEKRELRHAARAEMQIAVARQAMELREEARQQKKEEWAARKEYLRVTGRLPTDPPPTDWRGLEELKFPTDEEQDRSDSAQEAQEERDGQ